MLRVTPTLLESFRLYRDFDWMSKEDIIKSIKGDIEQTPKMQIGKAYDKLVFWEPWDEAPETIDGIVFDKPSAEQARMSGLYQVNCESMLDGILIRGKMDCIDGNEIRDLKAKIDYWKVESYIDSLQWQAYCHICGVRKFIYRIADLKQGDDSVWWTSDITDISLYYQSDELLRSVLSDLLTFVRIENLSGELET